MQTSRELVVHLVEALVTQYTEQLRPLPFKKGIREALIDGFRDGAREGAKHALQMVGVEIKD